MYDIFKIKFLRPDTPKSTKVYTNWVSFALCIIKPMVTPLRM